MNQYYAIISPGRGSDWGELILVDYRVAYFLEKVTSYFDEDDLEELKSNFTDITWSFLKEEFKSLDKEDKQFVEDVEEQYDINMSDNYYLLSELKSTLQFNSVTEVIKYVQKNNIEVVGDLT